MTPRLPEGEAVPADGSLPEAALTALRDPRAPGTDRFGIYVHVPYCATRCGYCDFNTYTPGELSGAPALAGFGQSAEVDSYLTALCAEIELSARVLGSHAGAVLPTIDTVFVGGGTPTLLATEHLATILARLDKVFGLSPEAEASTEANPESVTEDSLAGLVAAGFNRISLGMQSAVEHVLAVLDRQHTSGRAVWAAQQARKAGFSQVNLDLIYGAPTESDADWRASLETVIAAGVDHVSAYALTVEPGTRLARLVSRGELAATDDDTLADRYLLAERLLTGAGLQWYEISNWARTQTDRCRHNELYWRGGDWWGFGPGAHSHVGGVRWWNVKHPAAYAGRLWRGESPAHARELLDPGQRGVEDLMLQIRLTEGYPLSALNAAGRAGAAAALDDGLLQPDAYAAGRACLTLRGRLLADTVIGMLSS